MTWETRKEWARTAALGLAILLTFIASLGLALQDKPASATVMGGLFALTVILSQLSKLETIKAGFVEAKFVRQTLDEAQVTIEQFRKLMAISAEQAFLTMAKQGNWPQNDDIIDQNALAIEITDALMEAGVDLKSIEHHQKHFRAKISASFRITLGSAVHAVMYTRYKTIEKDVHRTETEVRSGKAEAEIGLEHTRRKMNAASALIARTSSNSLSIGEVSNLLSEQVVVDLTSSKDREVLLRIRQKISDLIETCHDRGVYSPEALSFILRYGQLSSSNFLGLLRDYGWEE